MPNSGTTPPADSSHSPSLPRVPSFRRSSLHFLLLQDPQTPLAPKGHGALTSLIKSRGSSTSLFHWRGDDEESAYGPTDTVGTHEGLGIGNYQDDDGEGAGGSHAGSVREERRLSALLSTPQVRSMRLIGNANPRYRWERYWKTEEELKAMKKQEVREYYARTNLLVQQYLYIDKLLDSSLPHDLLNEYNNMPASAFRGVEIPSTIAEEPNTPSSATTNGGENGASLGGLTSPASASSLAKKVKRTPKDIYRPAETTPLLYVEGAADDDDDDVAVADVERNARRTNGIGGYGSASNGTANEANGDGLRPGSKPAEELSAAPDIPWLDDDDVDSQAPVVTLAIYINFLANAILLAGKIAVIIRVPSVSVLASLVDAALDFLSTAIVWTTTWLISHQDQYRYPVGRRRLEPIGVLVFSVIMVTSFVQVILEAIQRLASSDHIVVNLGIPALVIMLSTIVIKGICWFWCRLVKNSSVQALAEDARTDIIFNAGSIAFPLAGAYLGIWWLDALGGLLLSLVVIANWSGAAAQHIKNLTGFSATADQRNILLYLTMRFAKTIKQIQGLQAYHAGDKLNVEVDIVLDASTSLKDSHDLSESLQYVLESVPIVDRAFVHADYASYNLPTHMQQQAT